MKLIKRLFFTLLLVLLTVSLSAEKPPIDHSVYDDWKAISTFIMSSDGNYSIYRVASQEGDSYLEILNHKSESVKRVDRGQSITISDDNNFLVTLIKPPHSKVVAVREKRLKKDKLPNDTLAIYNLKDESIEKVPNIKNYKLSKSSKGYIAYKLQEENGEKRGKKPAKKRGKSSGEKLMIRTLSDTTDKIIERVTHYNFSESGDTLFYVQVGEKESEESTLNLLKLKESDEKVLYSFNSKQRVALPRVVEDGKRLLFYGNLDTISEHKNRVSILCYFDELNSTEVVVDHSIRGLKEGWEISDKRPLQVSKDGKQLYFTIAKVIPKADSSIDKDKMAKLDIWHYKDLYVQPQQLVQRRRELGKTYLSTTNLEGDDRELTMIAAEEYHIANILNRDDNRWGWAYSNHNYATETQWSNNYRYDLYLIDLKSGESEKIVEGDHISLISPSPKGNFLTWYNQRDQEWYSYSIDKRETIPITRKIKASFAREDHDQPSMPASYSQGGWMEDDSAILIYDRYDVWLVDPSGKKKPVNLTDGVGRKEEITFRVIRLDETQPGPGARGVRKRPLSLEEKIYFTAFNNRNKESGYYYKDLGNRRAKMERWIMEPASFSYLSLSDDGETITYCKENFENSPNVWLTRDNFKNQKQISDINPQQREYNWGTVELIHWDSKIGEKIEGLLYKPESFDPNKKYPMIVYFYEKYSDRLNRYYSPAPSRSTINIPFFVSNNYIVFVPNIHYQIGYPGKSALDCIVPGVEKLIKENSWVDADNIGLQGQSWGGYQTSYMITKPEVFKWKAAAAGTPVSNMTSAYGGIRWGTGKVRQFQYEHTQSRLGKTLWEDLDLYIENSPLFFANKVETPLLIMHNDKDEMVPWYQGIEYFTALRRLGKPAWLLQYNDEYHNLKSRINAKDLSIRLEQFFNHFLKGEPMPVWLKSGVPATMKGVDWGFDLTN